MLLITGGTGFVGKHLEQELRRRNLSYRVFSQHECDLTSASETERLFAETDADAVIHMAAYQAAAEFPAKHTAEQFHRNSLIHLNVLEAWRRFLPQARLIAIGSTCAYPSNAVRLTEEVFMDGPIHGSVYSYAFTKRLLWNGIRAYNDQYQLNGSYLVPATMFGEHDDFNPETAHVTGALIGRFVKAAKDNVPEVEIWGDGTQVRDFMDVKEFVRVLLELVPQCERDIVNVGPGKGTSIRRLAEAIADACGYQGHLCFNAERYTGISVKTADTGKLRQRYGIQVNSDIVPAIRRTVEWLKTNYEVLARRKFAE